MPNVIDVIGARRPMAIGGDEVAEGVLEVKVSVSCSTTVRTGAR
jgi:hypothetical protein